MVTIPGKKCRVANDSNVGGLQTGVKKILQMMQNNREIVTKSPLHCTDQGKCHAANAGLASPRFPPAYSHGGELCGLARRANAHYDGRPALRFRLTCVEWPHGPAHPGGRR